MIIPIWRTLLLLWSLAVILAISLPWSKFDGTPHWDAIEWIPFAHLSFHRSDLFDFTVNILAFIPLGYLMVRSLSPGTERPLLLAGLLGFFSSASLEFYQLFCQGRVPSTTDLFANTGGTVLGAWAAARVDQLLSFSFVRLRRLS